jgi:hypothetical protein
MPRTEGTVAPAPTLSMSLLGMKLSHQGVLSNQPSRVEMEFGIRYDTHSKSWVFTYRKRGRQLRAPWWKWGSVR